MIGSICVGIWFRLQYLQRLYTLKEMQRGVSLLKGEIEYGRTPLPEACLAVSHRIRGSGQIFFRLVSEGLERGGGTVEEIWRQTMKNAFENRQLGQRDYEELGRLGNTLGYLDVEMQVRAMELCMRRLEESISDYEKERKNQTRLYPLVGTFSGFILCLVLV